MKKNKKKRESNAERVFKLFVSIKKTKKRVKYGIELLKSIIKQIKNAKESIM